MKSYMDKKDYLPQKAEKWKREQRFKAIEPDQTGNLGEGKHLITEKIDGELALLEIKNGKARFASRHGRIRMNLPVLDEISKLVKSKYALIMGELAAVDETGKVIPFNRLISVLRKPSDITRHWIRFFPFQILQLGKTKFTNSRQDRVKSDTLILKIFRNSRYVHHIRKSVGDSAKALEHFKKWKGEGIVIHTEKGKTFKLKKRGSFDLVVIAMQEGKGKNSHMAGNLYMTFYDGDRYYFAGKVGTGLSDSLRKKMWAYGKKNSVPYGGSKSSESIWVKPKIILEVKWLRIIRKPVPTYEYQNGLGWRYTGTKMGVMMQIPSLSRVRTDKKVNKHDLRLEQIPGWKS